VDNLPIIEHKCFAFVEPTVFFENSVLILPLELNCKTEKWLGRQDYSFGLWPYSPPLGLPSLRSGIQMLCICRTNCFLRKLGSHPAVRTQLQD
jgi:hypothetical protein